MTPPPLKPPRPMSLANDYVMLRESLSGLSRRFDAAHADALLAYPGTVWRKLEDGAKAELHEAAQDVADWSAPAQEKTDNSAALTAPDPVFNAPEGADLSQNGVLRFTVPADTQDPTGHPESV
jgi:hypothetical protein